MPDKTSIASMSISDIRGWIDDGRLDISHAALLDGDGRAGVRALADMLRRRHDSQEKERARLASLLAIERKLRAEGAGVVCGIDEAGRGPLAGPVVAAAVMLPPDAALPGLDDSKKLSAAKREELFERIVHEANGWGVGIVENDEIDDTNILDAAMKAMRDAVAGTGMTPDIVLVDGSRSPGMRCPERLIVDGDARCHSIAAASVVAKVTRDRIMVGLHDSHPAYGFDSHKGYGAASHIDAIRREGPSPLHRLTFRVVPRVSPPGTVAAVMRGRLERAACRETFERTVATIARMRDHMHEHDIALLRDCYRELAPRFRLNIT